jgi:hypothetical protein
MSQNENKRVSKGLQAYRRLERNKSERRKIPERAARVVAGRFILFFLHGLRL